MLRALAKNTTQQRMQKQLEAELERLKKILKTGYELNVKWLPNSNSKIAGEVRGSYIYVYDDDGDVALETLKHEVLDYAISKVVAPYKEVTNQLIAFINEDAYQRKERLIDSLTQLINREKE